MMRKLCLSFLIFSLLITNMAPAKASETKKPSLFAEIDRRYEAKGKITSDLSGQTEENRSHLSDFPSLLEFLEKISDDNAWTQKDRDLHYARRAVDDFWVLGWDSSIFALMPPSYISAFLKISGWVRVSSEGKIIIRDNSKINPSPIPLFDINMRFEERGLTPLMIAAQHNRFPEVISLLLEAGANANARDAEGIPVLVKALYNETPEVLKRLLSAGADPNALVNIPGIANNFSALIFTAMGLTEKAVPQKIAILLDAGANPKQKDSRGKRAIDYAKENPYLKNTPEYWRLHDASF